jgi:hypothetical protein
VQLTSLRLDSCHSGLPNSLRLQPWDQEEGEPKQCSVAGMLRKHQFMVQELHAHPPPHLISSSSMQAVCR